jgi:hypothetical protein
VNAIELFEQSFSRAEALLHVHKNAYPKGRPTAQGEAADLLRAIIVFEVAALDSYIHKRIMEKVKNIIKSKRRLPHACIPLVTRSQKQNEIPQDLIGIALSKKPENEILKRLRRGLYLQTFQKPDKIDEAFKMMELKSPWAQINKLVRPKRGPKKKGRKQDSRKFIADLVERRDDIVHEGDVYVGKKFHGKLKKISRTEVANGLQSLKRIVEAMEKITE